MWSFTIWKVSHFQPVVISISRSRERFPFAALLKQISRHCLLDGFIDGYLSARNRSVSDRTDKQFINKLYALKECVSRRYRCMAPSLPGGGGSSMEVILSHRSDARPIQCTIYWPVWVRRSTMYIPASQSYRSHISHCHSHNLSPNQQTITQGCEGVIEYIVIWMNNVFPKD